MRVEVLGVDEELGAGLSAAERRRAKDALWAEALVLRRGRWRTPPTPRAPAIGLLVLEGVLTREVAVAGGRCAEILGGGDVLRPWDDDRAEAPVPAAAHWRVIEPARLAVLDARFTEAVCVYPAVVVELYSRLIRRSRWLACLLAISDIRRLEPRLLAVLWHLADRWGSVGRDGVCLPLALTHETLGSLVGAARPSVTRSLRRLELAGALTARAGGGWTLHGEPTLLIALADGNPGYRAAARCAAIGVSGPA